MKIMLAVICLVGLTGCGATPQPAPRAPITNAVGQTSPDPEVVAVPVPVPVPVAVPILVPELTNMDVLRAVCWYMTDAMIRESIVIINDGWWAGFTYQDRLLITDDVCGADWDCQACWDAVVDFVYFVAH